MRHSSILFTSMKFETCTVSNLKKCTVRTLHDTENKSIPQKEIKFFIFAEKCFFHPISFIVWFNKACFYISTIDGAAGTLWQKLIIPGCSPIIWSKGTKVNSLSNLRKKYLFEILHFYIALHEIHVVFFLSITMC